jgi:hypothetical protein
MLARYDRADRDVAPHTQSERIVSHTESDGYRGIHHFATKYFVAKRGRDSEPDGQYGAENSGQWSG